MRKKMPTATSAIFTIRNGRRPVASPGHNGIDAGCRTSRLMNLPRRWWVTLAALGVGCLALRAGAAFQEREARLPRAPIDRQALVSRHDPVLRELDVEAPLSVGNGEFEFTADI